jgi:hypothetical protein
MGPEPVLVQEQERAQGDVDDESVGVGWRVMYRRWRLIMVISTGLAPAGWRRTVVSILVVRRGRSVCGRRTRLGGVVMV